MANNVVLNTGAGGSTIATEQNVTEQYQKIKITDGTGGAFTNMAAVTAAGALKVDNSANNQPAVGAAASGASKSGNPVQIGGVFNTTQPTVTTGQAVEAQATARGALIVATGVDGLTITPSGTQAISAASLPLPSGAATAAKQPALGTAGSASADVITVQGVTSMTALKVDGSGVTQPVSAASLPLPSGASTSAKQPALGTAGTASADVLTVQGITSMTALKVDGSGVTQPVSGTVTTTPPSNASTNLAQVAGTTTDVNSGVKSAGTLRVVLATDQPALTNKLLVTPDSVALPANQSVNVNQINAVTPLMGNGTTGTGSQRVTIASDNTAFSVNAVESGTWTVQPGNTANTTPWLSTNIAPSNGTLGWSFNYQSALAATKQQIKGSAGTFGGYIMLTNPNTAETYLQVFNKTSASVTVGSTAPDFVLRIPGLATASGTGVAANLELVNGLAMSTGITVAATTTATGSTAPTNALTATFLFL